jgi:hypothetical protein
MYVAADYPLLDIIWTMLVFFGWVIWFWLLITVFSDLFRRHDISGWGKAGWSLLVIQTSRAAFDDYVRDVASNGGATDQIAKGKQLLDSGAINAAEFEELKRKALAT